MLCGCGCGNSLKLNHGPTTKYLSGHNFKSYKNREISSQLCRKLGKSLIGIKKTKEHRKKLSLAHLGKDHPKDCLCMFHRNKYHSKNPNWQGGKSFEPYSAEFNAELKEKILLRDGYRCQNQKCEMTEEEHLIVYGRTLDVHHIDYNKKNCKSTNLIALCMSCNARANFNRPIWLNYYQQIILQKEEII